MYKIGDFLIAIYCLIDDELYPHFCQIYGRPRRADFSPCKALGFLDTNLVVSPPPPRRAFGVYPVGPGSVFYSRAVARSTVDCRGA